MTHISVRSTLAAEPAMTIDGVAYTTGQWSKVPNPACFTEIVGSFPEGDAGCAEHAVAAAKRAFRGWSALTAAARASLLAGALKRIEGEIPRWAALLTRENGKTAREAAMDIGAAIGMVQYYATQVSVLSDMRIEGEERDTVIRRKPFGVCVGFVPWNFPIALSAAKFAPALVAGNTMVVKAPDYAPLTLLTFLHHFASRLPPGVLNVVSGTLPELGARLVSHPAVRKVSFTGGKEVGVRVARNAADNVTAVTLELGGNDAAILLDDFEVTRSDIERIVTAAFTAAGQVCFGIKRLYVHTSKYDDTVAALQDALDRIVVGNPANPEVSMGPVNNSRQHASVLDLIRRTREAGIDVRELGSFAPSTETDNGYFIRPHLALNPPEASEVVAREQFGPILPVMSYDRENEVIHRANGTEYGLASSVWSRDRQRAERVADRLQAGMTFINGHGIADVDLAAPFGGVKHSGTGRELGSQGLLEYTETHSIVGHRES